MFRRVNNNKFGVIEYAIDDEEDLDKLPKGDTNNTVYAILRKDGKNLIYLYSKEVEDYVLINGDLEEINTELESINEQLDNIVHEKVNEVNNKINDLDANINGLIDTLKTGKKEVELSFVRGTIAGAGVFYDNTKHFRSSTYLKYNENKVLTFDIPNGYVLSLWCYNTEYSNGVNSTSKKLPYKSSLYISKLLY